MIRRPSATLTRLLGAALAAVFLASCGTASTTPTRSAAASSSRVPVQSGAASGSARASGTAGPSGSAGSSVSPAPSASDPLGLPHADAALEDLLPSKIGGVELYKFSLTLQAYMNSTTGGDKALYLPWLVKFGKVPGDVIIAVATDLTDQENFIAHAIRVPGVDAAALSSGFADVASKAGWPVKSHVNWGLTGKTLLEIIDPAAKAAGGLYDGFVYANDNVLYTVITDDQNLLLEAMIRMP
jgi:hypothetical protein